METFVHYYRCHELNDPNLFFFAIWVKWYPEKNEAHYVEVATVNPFNGNLETYDESWEQLEARCFTPIVTEITQDQFNDVRIGYINDNKGNYA